MTKNDRLTLEKITLIIDEKRSILRTICQFHLSCSIFLSNSNQIETRARRRRAVGAKKLQRAKAYSEQKPASLKWTQSPFKTAILSGAPAAARGEAAWIKIAVFFFSFPIDSCDISGLF